MRQVPTATTSPPASIFIPPIVSGNQVTLAATTLVGESNGDGTLATVTFEVVAVKASTLTLTEVVLSDGAGNASRPQVENGTNYQTLTSQGGDHPRRQPPQLRLNPKALGKASGATITTADMEKLTGLGSGGINIGSNISDLTGLEHATNLTWIGLRGGNNISDLSPLSGLTNLTDIDLAGNSISDLSPLSGLAQLSSLTLGGNSISDLSPLSGPLN